MDTSKKIGTMATRSESSVDMIEDAFIDYITPKTLNTMENENKCFFSISLENGITITGNSPFEVNAFLRRIHYGLAKAAYEEEEGIAKNLLRKDRKATFDAMMIIEEGLKRAQKQ